MPLKFSETERGPVLENTESSSFSFLKLSCLFNSLLLNLKALANNRKEDVNILILGETGVGKSTWINGIANYEKHKTLKDAMDDPEFTVLIPSR